VVQNSVLESMPQAPPGGKRAELKGKFANKNSRGQNFEAKNRI
jgi:hypothetical protein